MNENLTHRLAAIYARVSTLQQEQEATMDSQVAELEKYAQEKGLRLSKEFYFLDQAVSGAQLSRPALDRLRDLAVEGLFDTVLCLSPDRLSRKYAHQWILAEELKRSGVSVPFVNQPPVEDNPQGQLLLGIQGLFAEYERVLITERLRRGKLYRIRRGHIEAEAWVTDRVPPGMVYANFHFPEASANELPLAATDTVLQALKVMTDSRIGAVLVTDGDKIVGIYTERDYLRKGEIEGRAAKDTLIKDVMTPKMVTVKNETSVDECVALMKQYQIRHLPVVENGQIIGLVSMRDVMVAAIENRESEIRGLENYIMGSEFRT